MSKASKTILVTGGAGFIGSHVVELLCDKGYSVRVIDDLSFGYKKFVDKRAMFIEASIADTTKLNKALRGVDAVIHLAASSIIATSISDPVKTFDNNIANSVLLLEAMRRNNVKKIIYSSSASVYGEPLKIPIPENHIKRPMQPYGASKAAFENILSGYFYSFGIESVSLRYFNAYGPRDDQQPVSRAVPMWVKSILRGEPVKTYWQGKQIRDYVFVKDIAAAHLAVLRLSGCYVFNIGSGAGVKMANILKGIIKITKTKPVIIDKGERAGDPMRLVADTSLIKKAVGWKPQYSLKDGLKKTIEYYAQNI